MSQMHQTPTHVRNHTIHINLQSITYQNVCTDHQVANVAALLEPDASLNWSKRCNLEGRTSDQSYTTKNVSHNPV